MRLLQGGGELPRLPVDSLGDGDEDWQPRRAEKREKVVRIAEYSEYPRARRDQQRMRGFTRDQSSSGMCIAADKPEEPGTLLQLALRNVDGGATMDALVRVVWCRGRGADRYWIGVELLEARGRRMRSVRGTRGSDRNEGELSGRAGVVRLGDRRR